jgi:hypothetical protein
MKKLTIQNIEKLEGQIISEYRVQTIEVDDIHREDGYYIISCVTTTIGARYLTILINRKIYDGDGEHVKVSFETSAGNRTAWFPVWLENIQSVEEFVEKIKWNINNREWF